MVFPIEPPPTTADIPCTPKLLDAAAKTVHIALRHAAPILARGLNGAGQRADVTAIRAAVKGRERAARLRLHGFALEAAQLAAESAIDHLRALAADLTRELPAPTLSHLTPVRVALEAGGMFGYLTDRNIHVNMRLARIAGIRIADTDSAMKLAVSHDIPAMVTDMRVATDALSAVLTAAGVTYRRSRRGDKLIEVTLDTQVTKGDIPISKAARDFLGPAMAQHDPYNLLSGAAHLRPWMHVSNQSTQPGAGSVTYALWSAREILANLLQTWGTYTGEDIEDPVKRLTYAASLTLSRAQNGDFSFSSSDQH